MAKCLIHSKDSEIYEFPGFFKTNLGQVVKKNGDYDL